MLQQGTAQHLGLTIGTGATVVGLALLVIALWLRELPGLGTVVSIVLTGMFLDATLAMVGVPEVRMARAAYLIAGTATMTFGGALLISARLGAHPIDAVTTGAYKRLPFSLYQVRVGLEALGLVLGVLAGGSAGIGSVFIGLTVGPFLQAWLQVLRSMPERPPPGGRLRGALCLSPASGNSSRVAD